MPIDKETLKTAMREAVGDGELYQLLEPKLMASDDAATKFLAGFMRNRDYTTKTQALASDRQSIADEKAQMEQQLVQYRQLLETAEADKARVMKDLQKRNIDVATAHQRLKNIKETYSLSDEDVPVIPDLIETYQSKKVVDSSADIDSRMADLKKDIMADVGKYLTEKLVPELGGMAQLDITWNDILEEHKELTGKRLPVKEQQTLLNEAGARIRAGKPTSLKALWEEKYEVPDLRQKMHDGTLEKEFRAKWDAEQQAKLSEAAIQGIKTPTDGLRTSHIFDHKFKVHEEAPASAPKPRETPSAAEREALSGAQRATQRHMQRRNAGLPLGAPDERKGGGKAA